jgi:hypothetical protein
MKYGLDWITPARNVYWQTIHRYLPTCIILYFEALQVIEVDDRA